MLSVLAQVFEEESNSWDERLTRVRVLLDVWIDVQRRWVYLEGLFVGSMEIQAQLPKEYARFDLVNHDFMNLMKKVRGLLCVVYGRLKRLAWRRG